MDASSNFAAVAFFTVLKMCRHRVNVVLDEKNMFANMPHVIDPEVRKMLVQGMFGNKIPHSILVLVLPCIEIRILYLKLAM